MGIGYGFRCKYCGEAFGNRPDELEKHIIFSCDKTKESIIQQDNELKND